MIDITREEFAVLSWHRDVSVLGFSEVGPYTGETKADYLQEADYYLAMKSQNPTDQEPGWPCDILESIGKHEEVHGKDCTGNS